MAIDNNNSAALVNFGNYYHFIEKNYTEMKKYYLMVIENNNYIDIQNYIICIHNLAYYYQYIEKNYIEMKKYYLIAIKHGIERSINNYNIYKSKRIKHKDLIIILNNYLETNDITLFKPLKNKIIKYHKISNDIECPICMENILIIQLPCHFKHNLCLKCLLNLTNNTCPYCRKLIY